MSRRPGRGRRAGALASAGLATVALAAVPAAGPAAAAGAAGVQASPEVSRVRINQVGYLPSGPKAATLVTARSTAVPWALRDAAGRTVRTGTTVPRGTDPSAGVAVHVLTFSAHTVPGSGYTLLADGATSAPFEIGSAAYERLRRDSKTLFYTNRSGTPVLDALVPGYGRAAGHAGAAPNRGDVAVPCLPAGDDAQRLYTSPWTCDGTSDVRGGWYDAGDHGKYVVTGSVAVAQLLQEYERSEWAPSADRGALGDRTLRVPEAGNGVPDLLDEARWELEWLLRMQVKTGRPLAGMAFHKVADLDWTGLPTAPAADAQPRALFRPSTAATYDLAAATAHGARVFARWDATFSARLLAAARRAYAAATAGPLLLAPAPRPDVDPDPGSGPYDDTDVTDERYWAAAELYLSTRESAFARDLVASPRHTSDVFPRGGYDWRRPAALGRLDLATVPNALPSRSTVQQSVVQAADRYLADQAAQPFGQAYAPVGGRYGWGSNSGVLHAMQVLGTAYDLTGSARYRNGVVRSADYLLGRNALGQSYVTGYGSTASRNQHSRMYARQLDPSLPHPPAGTIAGGPNSTAASSGDPVAGPLLAGCAAQTCYVDDIGSWSTNELTVDWNAPLSWVASFLADQDSGGAVASAARPGLLP